MTLASATSPSDAADRRWRCRRHLLVALALSALTFLLFVRTAGFDFVNLDDHEYIVRNQRTLQGLTWTNARWALTTGEHFYWHPLTWLSYMAEVSVYGAGDLRTLAGGMHLTNTVLHALAAGLCYLAIAALTRHGAMSALVASLFAVHPLRVESVAWIAERKDVLSGVFFFLTLLCYARFARSRSPAWYGAMFGGFLLAAMAKPTVVTLPCVLLLLDFWPLRRVPRQTLRSVVLEKIPLLAMALAVAAVTFVTQRQVGAVVSVESLPVTVRLGNAVLSYGRYVGMTFWPAKLAAWYPHPYDPPDVAFPWPKAMLAGVALVAITAIAVAMWRRERAVLVGWLWFVGMLVPTIGLFQAGEQALADRFTYLPHAGLFIAIAWGVAAATPRAASFQRALRAAAILIVLALVIATSVQLRHWQNSRTLFTHALEVTDRNDRAHVCLGIWHQEAGNADQALRHYRDAAAIAPDNAEAHNNLGYMLDAAGDTAEAMKHITRAVRLDPDYAEAHNNLANLLARRGGVEQAIRHHERAIELDPDLAQAHYNYGVTLAGAGRFAEAQARLERALQLRPDHADGRYAYGLVMAARGYEVAAVGQLREANFLRPDWFEALRSLAWLLATSPEPRARDGRQAVIVAERANGITGYENPVALDTLAAAYAAAGQFDSAVKTAARAEQLARSRGEAALADRFAARLELYRRGKPFHRIAGATTQPMNP